MAKKETALFRFLGTGASAGVPVIGCHCPVCSSSNSKNKRNRSAGYIESPQARLLIDVGPDIRYQALHFGIERIDGLLLTHPHYDHIAGLDDLRIFSQRQQQEIPLLASHSSCQDLEKRYDYLFQSLGINQTVRIALHVLPHIRGAVEFLGLKVHYVSYLQGKMPVTGYRLGDFAYITDIRDYPETIFEDLAGVRWLVLSALHLKASPIHFGLEEAVDFADKVKAKMTYLTHLSHTLDYEEANRLLPSNVQLGYDGLQFRFQL